MMAAAGAVVVLAGAGTGIWFAARGRTSSGTASPVSVTTQNVTVSTGTMKQTVAASGTLQPAQDSNLTFAVAGRVNAVDVTTGQQVNAGQTLATVDPTVLSDQVAAAQATLTAAEDRLSADQAAGASTSQVDSDQASVTSAQSQLATAQANLSDASLKAPFAGTVASVGLAVGDTVSGGGGNASGSASSGGGSSARTSVGGLAGVLSALAGSSAASTSSSPAASGVTLISTNSFTVSTSVDDTEVGQVKVGDQAVIVPTGSSNDVYGTVASVGLIASPSSGSVASFPVVISVTGDPSGLYAGASASVSIIVKQLNDVVEVPTAAITYTNGQATVTRVRGGTAISQPVTTGISAAGQTQITSGLQAGDVVRERVVKFNGVSGAARTLFGGAGRAGGGRFGGGFGGGGFGGGAGRAFFGGGAGAG